MKQNKQSQNLFSSILAFAKAANEDKNLLKYNAHKLLFESIIIFDTKSNDENLVLNQIKKLDDERMKIYPKCEKYNENIIYIKEQLSHTEELLKDYLFSIICSLSKYTDVLINKKNDKEFENQINFIYDALFTIDCNQVLDKVRAMIPEGLQFLSSTVNRVYI